MIRQTGITTDNRIVLGGVFPLVGTHGIPLEIVLAYFKERGRVVDWPEYIGGALKDGHKPRGTIKSRIAQPWETYSAGSTGMRGRTARRLFTRHLAR